MTLPTDDALVHARDLLTYLHAAPTPHHVVSETSGRLDAAGFSPLDQTAEWPATWRAHDIAASAGRRDPERCHAERCRAERSSGRGDPERTSD